MNEILFEIIPMGNAVKVVAVDAETGTEVSIQGPATAGDETLKQAAMRKLIYVMKKQKEGRK